MLDLDKIQAVRLYDVMNADVPIPSGLETILEDGVPDAGLSEWFDQKIVRLVSFSKNLAGYDALDDTDLHHTAKAIRKLALANYRSKYLELASKVPEFAFWSQVRGHVAVRDDISALRSEITMLHEQLAKLKTSDARIHSTRKKLARVYKAVLSHPIIVGDLASSDHSVGFPTVEEGFVPPGYQVVPFSSGLPVASDAWWSGKNVYSDLYKFFLAHFSSVASWQAPTLLLGHPGAGKSLLTRVLAASFPVEKFLVIRVPLRHVNPHAPIYEQIEDALKSDLHESVRWAELSEVDPQVQRVIFLDGLDELIQVSGAAMTGYLQRVREFQAEEANLERPVSVVVTSRALVADRMEIPLGSPVIRLNDFSDDQIGSWLATWLRVNGGREGFRSPTVASVLRQGRIGRQPLMLLLLALYEADQANPSLANSGLTLAKLYRSILTGFFLREARKDQVSNESAGPSGQVVNIEKDLWQLSIAAFGMFNRGHQYISEPQLVRDIEALDREALAVLPENQMGSLARDVLERFFFVVHVNEAVSVQGGVDRTYEFLHATFAEYLVAYQTFNSVVTLGQQHQIQGSITSPWAGTGGVDDSLTQAVLSHRCLAPSGPIRRFLAELVSADSAPNPRIMVDAVSAVLNVALERGISSDSRSSRFSEYAPTGGNFLRKLACYTANLVSFAVIADPDTSTRDLVGGDGIWVQLVHLWESSLSHDEFTSLLDLLVLARHDDIRQPDVDFSELRSVSGALLAAGVTVPTHSIALELMGEYGAAAQMRVGSVLLDSASPSSNVRLLDEIMFLVSWEHLAKRRRTNFPRMLSPDLIRSLTTSNREPVLLLLASLAARLSSGSYEADVENPVSGGLIDASPFDHVALEVLAGQLGDLRRAGEAREDFKEQGKDGRDAEYVRLLQKVIDELENSNVLEGGGGDQ